MSLSIQKTAMEVASQMDINELVLVRASFNGNPAGDTFKKHETILSVIQGARAGFEISSKAVNTAVNDELAERNEVLLSKAANSVAKYGICHSGTTSRAEANLGFSH